MERVALIGENSIEYIDALIEIWNNEDSAVLLDWRLPLEKSFELMKQAGVKRCIIEGRYIDKNIIKKYNDIEIHEYNSTYNDARLLPDTVYRKYMNNMSKNEAVVLYSSGTTGMMKGVILTHYALSCNADAIIEYMDLQRSDCIYIVKSLTHSSSLTGELLVGLRAHINILISKTIIPPRYILSKIADYSVTILCLNPMLLDMFVSETERKNYDIKTLKKVYCSGGILNDHLYQKANECLKGVELYNVYGLTEAGPRVTAQRKNSKRNNSVGIPIKGVDIKIVSDDGYEVKNGEAGLVYVSTPSIYSGYISGDSKSNLKHGGWINTKDLGYLDCFGELHIIGRSDDMVVIQAHNIYAPDVERILLKCVGVKECCVTKCYSQGKEILGCMYVGDEIDNLGVYSTLKKQLAPYEIPQIYKKVNEIPRNYRGKINREEIGTILTNL